MCTRRSSACVFRRATQAFVGAQIELLAGDIAAAERELRGSTQAFDEIGATTSATTHRALLGEVLVALGRFQEAEELARRIAAEAPEHDVIAQVLWRCTLSRIKAREGSAREAVELATEARRLLADAEFPQLAIAALTAAAEAAAAADEIPEAEQLLAQARQVAEAKGAVAGLPHLDTVLSG